MEGFYALHKFHTMTDNSFMNKRRETVATLMNISTWEGRWFFFRFSEFIEITNLNTKKNYYSYFILFCLVWFGLGLLCFVFIWFDFNLIFFLCSFFYLGLLFPRRKSFGIPNVNQKSLLNLWTEWLTKNAKFSTFSDSGQEKT